MREKKKVSVFSSPNFIKNRRGLSAIIITLILVLLSIVAVGVVWVVVSNILKSQGEETSSALGGLFLNLKLERVSVDPDTGEISVLVKRGPGDGDLTGVNLIVSDGKNSQVIPKSGAINELETKTFTIQQSDLTDVAFAKSVSLAPITESGGKEVAGNAVDKFEFNHLKLIYDHVSNNNCVALGWTNPPAPAPGGDTAECGESDKGFPTPTPFCKSKVNLVTARNICESIGARLCTRGDLRAGAADATGCSFNNGDYGLWTSTECGNNGFYVESGIKNDIEYCEENIEATVPTGIGADTGIAVRCCADN